MKKAQSAAEAGAMLSPVQEQYFGRASSNPLQRKLMTVMGDEYAKVISKVPDADLNTLMTVPDCDPSALFQNLSEFFLLTPKPGSKLDRYSQVAEQYSALAVAIRKHHKYFQGRLTTGWFMDSLLFTPSRWQQNRAARLRKLPEFVAEYREIQDQWPSNLMEFRNTSVPSPYSFLIDPTKSLVDKTQETSFFPYGKQAVQCPAAFVTKARRFVRKWSLRSLYHFGAHTFQLPVPCFVSDFEGQGTWAYIPRGYSLASITKLVRLRTLLASSYDIFEPTRRTYPEKFEDCKQYVIKKLNGDPPTPEVLRKLTDSWCNATVIVKGQRQRRLTSESRRRFYRCRILRAFGF